MKPRSYYSVALADQSFRHPANIRAVYIGNSNDCFRNCFRRFGIYHCKYLQIQVDSQTGVPGTFNESIIGYYFNSPIRGTILVNKIDFKTKFIEVPR